MARIKPDTEVIENRAQAEGALAEMAALERKMTAIKCGMQEEIDLAKAKAGQQAAPIEARFKELSKAVGVYAKLNKQELFTKGKSVDMGFGIIGFRASSRVVQMRGVTAEMTLERLHQYGLTDGIRVKEEVNREVCLGWPDERLELVGMARQSLDTFYIELKQESLPHEKGV